jgi:hypothetical protein
MSKLLKLREWLLLPEAAKYLSLAVGEPISEADLLRLALDKRLTLSTHFVNLGVGQVGRVVPIEQAKTHPPLFPKEGEEEMRIVSGVLVSDTEVLQFEDEVARLDGVYDLPMLGAERIDVERRFQKLTKGPRVELMNLDGPLVVGKSGVVIRLLESCDDNPFVEGSSAQIERAISRDFPSDEELREKRKAYKPQRDAFLKTQRANREAGRDIDNYYPADSLPDDAVFVVRTASIREFEQSLQGADAEDTGGGDHANFRSSKLAVLIEASRRFWGAHSKLSRADHPTNDKVAVWLEKNGFSASLAREGAKIIRPDWSVTGRPPEN